MVPGAAKVPKVPGDRALAFASRWFDPAIVHRVFDPLVADWQREWNDSEPAHRPWVSMRGFGAFAIATIVSSPAIVTTAPSPSVVRRVTLRVVTFVSVIATVLAIPLIMDTRPFGQAVLPLLLAAIPSGAVLAFPFSMMLAVDVIRREHGLAPHVARATAIKLAFSAVILMVIGQGFLMPAANHHYRTLSYRQSLVTDAVNVPAHLRSRYFEHVRSGYFTSRLSRGTRELTTLELVADAARAEPAARYTRSGSIRSELTNRAVLALMPAIFVWLRWLAHDVRRPRRFWPLPVGLMVGIASIGFFASYWTGLLAETTWHLRPGDGMWLPIIVATLIGVVQQRITSRRSAAALGPSIMVRR